MIETGIRFGDIHSFFDLDLILSSVEISPAVPQTSYVEIEGRDGALDTTEAHGELKYSDRTGCKFTFSMNPQSDLSESAWERKKTEVSNALNGKAFRITLDKDADYYYAGRCTVDQYQSNKRLRQFVISARLQPYKYKQEKTVVTVPLTATEKTVILKNGRKTVTPIITASHDNTHYRFGNTTGAMDAGSMEMMSFQLTEGDNVISVWNSDATGATVSFEYQEADL